MSAEAPPHSPPSSRGMFLAASAAVLAIGAWAWVQAGVDRYRPLREQGETLARTLVEGSRTALDAVRALEAALATRLEGAARRLDRALPADEAGAAEALEFRTVDLEERLSRVFLHAPDGRLLARAPRSRRDDLDDSPDEPGAAADRAAAAEEEDAVAEARALLKIGAPVAVRGLAADPFGTRARFGVALRRMKDRGAILVRAEAGEVRALRDRVGLEDLLWRAATAPGVAGISVHDAEGSRLASAGASPPGGGFLPVPPSIEVAVPFDAGEVRGGSLGIRLSTAGIDAVVSRARRGVLAATAAALLLALGSLAVLERARARAAVEAEARRAREERDRRLASLGELGAGVAHEIRNPLNAVDLAVQRLAREVKGATPEDGARLAEMTAIVRREVKGLDRLVDSFLRFARAPDARLAPADLAAAVRAETALFAPEAEARGVRVEVREEPPVPPVALDAALFSQALRNLLRNALEASPPGGPVEVVVGAEGPQARVEVRDRGPGVPEAERDRVFEFFHTGKEGGTGLGLPLALRSVRSHGGTIVLRDGPGGGARFVVLLPAAEATS